MWPAGSDFEVAVLKVVFVHNTKQKLFEKLRDPKISSFRTLIQFSDLEN